MKRKRKGFRNGGGLNITGVKISHIGSGSVIMVLRNVERGVRGFQQECSKSSTYRPSS